MIASLKQLVLQYFGFLYKNKRPFTSYTFPLFFQDELNLTAFADLLELPIFDAALPLTLGLLSVVCTIIFTALFAFKKSDIVRLYHRWSQNNVMLSHRQKNRTF